MKVLLTDNAHLFKTPDGKYYTPSIYSYSFFEPYLEVFDEVRFASRTKYVDTIDTDNYLLVSGEGLEIYELPWYQGVRGIVNNFIELVKRYRKASDGCDCSIMRVSQMESYLTYFLGQVKNKPFALEVVNDPSTLNVGPKIINYLNKRIMKIMIKKANGVSYVTENYLQDLCPSNSHFKGESPEFFHSHYTDVDLLQNDILKKPRTSLVLH